MMKSVLKLFFCIILCGILLPNFSFGQDQPVRNELESVLRLFKNYRFGTISLWELKNLGDLRRAVQAKERKATGTTADESCVKNADPSLLRIVEQGVNAGDDVETIAQSIVSTGIALPEFTQLECIFNYYKSKVGVEEIRIEKGYIVTTRPDRGELPDTIIALIVSYDTREDIERNLRSVSPQNIYTIHELKTFKLDTSYTADNLYDLMMNAIVQQAVENKTLEAQGIGTLIKYADKRYGVSRSLATNESDVRSWEVQQFLRISDGQAFNYNIKEHEVIISPDLISWRRYKLPVYVNDDGTVDTISTVTNSELPSIGVELRYGIDEINYPSFWSERLTASAIWQNVKLGVILPTEGWAKLSEDLFNQDRKLTYAGVGISGGFDFPIKVIPQSGVFHMAFGYVFGDPVQSSYKKRDLDPEVYIYADNDLYNDYLIRGNFQFHYTFGVKVDNDYWFRFSIGGTVYNAEKWFNVVDIVDLEREIVYKKYSDESIIGVSGRIEFMATNISTPFGASLQYFDEALSANLWLQIPVIQNALSLRLDCKGFFTAFRATRHAWEPESVFIPMARLVVLF